MRRDASSSLSARFVRFPLTTRWRSPFALWYVTSPADCAPRIIVISSMRRSSLSTRLALAWLRIRSPKFPQ